MFYQIQRYTKYLLVSRTRYTIHSPFVFDFVNKVLRDKAVYDDYVVLDKVKSKLMTRNDLIETVDFGAGAGNKKYATKILRLGSLVKLRSQRKKQLQLLYRLTRYFKPKTILEFGTAAGISASYMKRGYPEASLLSMEGCASVAAIAEEVFAELKLKDVEVKVGNFDSILPTVLSQLETLDLVFFDGNHRKEPTLNYFQQCLSLANENSVFVFDDIHWSSGMELAWKKVKNDPAVTLTIDLFWFGLVFFRKGIEKQNFIIRY